MVPIERVAKTSRQVLGMTVGEPCIRKHLTENQVGPVERDFSYGRGWFLKDKHLGFG